MLYVKYDIFGNFPAIQKMWEIFTKTLLLQSILVTHILKNYRKENIFNSYDLFKM